MEPASGPFFESCVIAARAAYCQDDDSYTRNGTPVDLFDVIPTPVGFDSMNPTVGFSVNPYEGKKMLHEEYQILVDGYVSDVYPAGTIDPVVVKLVPGLYGLRLSALATSRYPDLDPGRECRAEPYILGRCNPGAPFSCRRADAAAAYPDDRAYIAVNSAAHCAHKETEQGAPLESRVQRMHSPDLRGRPHLLRQPGRQPVSRQPRLGRPLHGSQRPGLSHDATG